MEFVQWESTRIKGKTSRDLGTGPAMYPFINKIWIKRRSEKNSDRAALLLPEGPEHPSGCRAQPRDPSYGKELSWTLQPLAPQV